MVDDRIADPSTAVPRRRAWRRTFRLVVAALLLTLSMLLAGCSRTGLLYNNADWLAERWASDLVDATDAQQESWQTMFASAMSEHRRELLPELVALLRTLETLAADGLTGEELRCWIEAADDAYRRHAEWAVPAAVAVLGGITPQQVDYMAAELADRNEEYRENYLDDDLGRREEERVERFTERIEYWTGDLSTDQLRLVEQAVRQMPDLAGDWLDYRRQQQRRLLALLRGSAGETALASFLTDWWVGFGDRPPALREKTPALRRDWQALVLALDASLDDGQRETFLEKLADLRGDLEAVPGDGEDLMAAWTDAAPCLGLSGRRL